MRLEFLEPGTSRMERRNGHETKIGDRMNGSAYVGPSGTGALALKEDLETAALAGKKILEVAYDPATVSTVPGVPPGTTVFYQESTTYLVEIIYTT